MRKDYSSIGSRTRMFKDSDGSHSSVDGDVVNFVDGKDILIEDDSIIDIEIDDEIGVEIDPADKNGVIGGGKGTVNTSNSTIIGQSQNDNYEDIPVAVVTASRTAEQIENDAIEGEEFDIYDESEATDNQSDHLKNDLVVKSSISEPETPLDSTAIKMRTLLLQQERSRVNSFDLFFIKVWALLTTIVAYCAGGINYLIKGIFKKKAPLKYVKAAVVLIFVILLLVAIIVPIYYNANNGEDDSLVVFSSNLLAVQVETSPGVYKWGYIHKSDAAEGGSTEAFTIPPIYEEALPFNQFKIAWVRVTTDSDPAGYWQLINTKGNQVGERNVPNVGIGRPVGEFTDNKLCWFRVGETGSHKYGYVNTRGDISIDRTYDEAENFVDGIANVGRGGKEWFINSKNKVIGKENFYDEAYSFSNGLAAVNLNNRWGYVDTKGKEVISMQFDAVTVFVDGYAMVKVSNTFGIINTKGEKVVSYIEYADINIDNEIFKQFILFHSNKEKQPINYISQQVDYLMTINTTINYKHVA